MLALFAFAIALAALAFAVGHALWAQREIDRLKSLSLSHQEWLRSTAATVYQLQSRCQHQHSQVLTKE